MSIKYFCDDCGKELKFDGFAEETESAGWGDAIHYHDIGIVHEDRENEDMTQRYQHTCRECDLKENGKDSWYFEEIEVYYKNNYVNGLCYPHCSTAKKFAEQFNEKNYLREKGKTLSRSSLEHIRSLGYTINVVPLEKVSND